MVIWPIFYRHSAPVVTDIHAHEAGYIKELPAMAFWKIYPMQLGAGRATKSDSLLIMKQELCWKESCSDAVAPGALYQVYSQKFYLKNADWIWKNVIIDGRCKETTEIVKIIR